MLDEGFLCCISAGSRGGQDLFHVWSIRKPGKAVDMKAAMMLPLKAKPEVSGTKNTNVESIDELLDAMVEEPVSNGRVLLEGLTVAGAEIGVVRTDESCELWPLEVSCAVGEKHCGQTECIHHGNELAPLLEPVLPCST